MYREMVFALGGNIALLAAVAWLIKSVLTHFLEKDIEIYKQELKTANDKALIEHDTVFRSLHSKRADVIAQLHTQLVELSGCLNSVNTELQNQKLEGLTPEISIEKSSKISHCLSPCWDYFSKNRLYFSGELSDKIERLLINCLAAGMLTLATQNLDLSSLPFELRKGLQDRDKTDLAERISKIISGFNEAIKEVETSFRTLVGITG